MPGMAPDRRRQFEPGGPGAGAGAEQVAAMGDFCAPMGRGGRSTACGRRSAAGVRLTAERGAGVIVGQDPYPPGARGVDCRFGRAAVARAGPAEHLRRAARHLGVPAPANGDLTLGGARRDDAEPGPHREPGTGSHRRRGWGAWDRPGDQGAGASGRAAGRHPLGGTRIPAAAAGDTPRLESVHPSDVADPGSSARAGQRCEREPGRVGAPTVDWELRSRGGRVRVLGCCVGALQVVESPS